MDGATTRAGGCSGLFDAPWTGHSTEIFGYNFCAPTSDTAMSKSSSVIALVAGALGLIPWISGYVVPDRQLQFTLTGLVDVSRLVALRVDVENRGKLPEKNVQIVLDSAKKWVYDEDQELEKQIEVDAKVPVTTKRDGDRLIVSLGDLRPKESATVGIASRYIVVQAYATRSSPYGLSVKSDDSLADYENGAGFFDNNLINILAGLSLLVAAFGAFGIFRLTWDASKAPRGMATSGAADSADSQSEDSVKK